MSWMGPAEVGKTWPTCGSRGKYWTTPKEYNFFFSQYQVWLQEEGGEGNWGGGQVKFSINSTSGSNWSTESSLLCSVKRCERQTSQDGLELQTVHANADKSKKGKKPLHPLWSGKGALGSTGHKCSPSGHCPLKLILGLCAYVHLYWDPSWDILKEWLLRYVHQVAQVVTHTHPKLSKTRLLYFWKTYHNTNAQWAEVRLQIHSYLWLLLTSESLNTPIFCCSWYAVCILFPKLKIKVMVGDNKQLDVAFLSWNNNHFNPMFSML